MPLPVQLLGQPSPAFTGPPQRRLWIAARDRLHQISPVTNQRCVPFGHPLATAAWPPHSASPCRLRILQLGNALSDHWREMPVTRDTAEIPPRSKAKLSAAATSRCERSSNNLLSTGETHLDPGEVCHPSSICPNILKWKCYF